MIRVKNKGDDKILYRTYRITVRTGIRYRPVWLFIKMFWGVVSSGTTTLWMRVQESRPMPPYVSRGEEIEQIERIQVIRQGGDIGDTGDQARWRYRRYRSSGKVEI